MAKLNCTSDKIFQWILEKYDYSAYMMKNAGMLNDFTTKEPWKLCVAPICFE